MTEQTALPALAEVDHILYGAPDLQAGMDEIERLLGMRPVIGGCHADFGTHNALLSLGPTAYLEVIAPDPDQPSPARGVLFDLRHLARPRVITWVLRTEAIEARVAAAAERGLALGDITGGRRENPDGSTLTWKVTDPYAMPFGGAVPFLITWGNTPHPSGIAPQAGNLTGLRFEHPDSDGLASAFRALGIDFPVSEAVGFRMVATIETGAGIVTLS